MKIIRILLFMVAVAAFASCGTSDQFTRGNQYSQLYEEKPLSIVIMPPINQTGAVEAKDYFYTTLYMPLCEKGYYVFSPQLTMDLFKQESAYDAELYVDGDLSKFREVLGADAAMFTIIKSWDRNNFGGAIRTDVVYWLRSTKTGETLFKREGQITLNTNFNVQGGGVIGALVGVIATAVKTAATDVIVVGRKCSSYMLNDLPAGKYDAAHFGKDKNMPAGKPLVSRVLQ